MQQGVLSRNDNHQNNMQIFQGVTLGGIRLKEFGISTKGIQQ
jgi:hypothetical protein